MSSRHAMIWIGLMVLFTPAMAQESNSPVARLGIIGLDTSHVVAFTEYINKPEATHGCRIVAAFPGGSQDIPSSRDRVEGYTKDLRDRFGVEIVDSIEALCQKVDGILLESVDGRPHLEQVKPVLAAKKPVFIDKPMAGNLADVIRIFNLAKANNVPCWSSSSLRFSPGRESLASNPELGDILGCEAYSPCELESHHPDLYWYGVHGVELLFSIMGPGCQSVSRMQTAGGEMVMGTWQDGRIGSFRGIRSGKKDYGAIVFGSKGIVQAGKYEGYGALCDQIIQFFKTGQVPVPDEETIEIFAFMTAADESKAQEGKIVSITEVIEKAKKEAESQ